LFLSKTSEYAIRLVFYLLKEGGNHHYIRLRKIAPELGVSFYQLTKVAQKLIQAGILDSYTGPNGGVALKKSPDGIRLIDIVAPIEGEDLFDKCMLGLGECGDDDPCPVHEYWEDTKLRLKRLFNEMTLEEMREHYPMGRLSQKETKERKFE